MKHSLCVGLEHLLMTLYQAKLDPLGMLKTQESKRLADLQCDMMPVTFRSLVQLKRY